MPVYLVAAAQSLAYLFAVPVCAVLRLSMRNGARLGFGVSAFDGRLAAARARRAAPARRRGGSGTALRILRRLRGAAICLSGRLNLGDAAATAMACGALCALAAAAGAGGRRLRIDVVPLYDAARPEAELQCMIRARAGQIIAAAARSGVEKASGRIAQWRKNTRSKAS